MVRFDIQISCLNMVDNLHENVGYSNGPLATYIPPSALTMTQIKDELEKTWILL